MELTLRRKATLHETTFGQLFVDGVFECHTLEDAIREVDGEPVALWKVHGETAIPSGRYRITLENSPHFGIDSLTLNDVPGFTDIRIHSGVSAVSTEGCLCVGDSIDIQEGAISGGLMRGVLKRLKAKVSAALDAGADVWIEIINPGEKD